MQQCLANTGTSADLALWLSGGGLLLAAGIGLLLASRRSTVSRAVTLTVLGAVGVLLLSFATPAPAHAGDCPDPVTPVVSAAPSSSGTEVTAAPTGSRTTAAESVPVATTTTPTSAGSPSPSSPAATTPTTGPSTTVPSSTVPSSSVPSSTVPEPVCVEVNDKALVDTDGDGVLDRCDLDSDNDGILDSEEDLNNNALFEDDDVDGDLLIIAVLGDGLSSYLDLDSDNDGVLDLMEGRPFTAAQINAWDFDLDGILDPALTFGTNGLADVLETSPDSGVLLPQLATVRNTDGDDKPDFVDLRSDGTTYDLYAIDRSDLDLLGGGFITPIDDSDADGIMAGVDTDSTVRGAPGSPLSPYGT